MKTSNRLLLALAVVLLAGLISTNFVLKAEYEDIKAHPRPQEGFRFVEVPAFSHVKVNSLSSGIRFSIQQSNRPSVQVNDSLATRIRTQVRHDTLFIDLSEQIAIPKTTENPAGEQMGMSVTATELISITFENGLGIVSGWDRETARIELHNRSQVNSYRNKLTEMYVTTHDQAVFTLEDDNEIKKLHAVKSDSSEIQVEGISVRSVQVK